MYTFALREVRSTDAGEYDFGPEFDFVPNDFFNILGCCIDLHKDEEGLFNEDLVYVIMIELFVLEKRLSFFKAFADTCHRIVSGEVTGYHAMSARSTALRDYYSREAGFVGVTEQSKNSAQRFIGFLNAHPEYWPVKN
ncbi:hypothetical protein [Ponticaulis sp.]|uniref:hypothetical protein n=1 Tax=Ponticaulis sp. TaxID=2020902 RepID=UPI00262BE57C|nr:hypothetical protein [Ponticaulis sp.]MDF1682169.1 hypothetical protein [Ponticaulis sp.]